MPILMAIVMLTGCSGQHQELNRAMTFRASLLSGMGCSFQAVITADYQEELYTFTLDCHADEQGGLSFTVVEPETISGITGVISAQGGKLTFDDDQILAFETLADGQLAPVTAPWVLVKTLRGGYVRACGMDEQRLRVTIDDSYQEDALQLDIWFTESDVPQYVEILWADRRILSMEVKDFEIL